MRKSIRIAFLLTALIIIGSCMVTGPVFASGGWHRLGSSWQYTLENGSTATGWNKIDGKWYYFDTNGVMQHGWLNDGARRYYLGWPDDPNSGAMRRGWLKDGDYWYYLGYPDNPDSGAMRTGWLNDNGTWYYLKPSGEMAENEYVGGWWLSAGGRWTYPHRASWHNDSAGWWYGDESSWYAQGSSFVIDDIKYYFNIYGYLSDEDCYSFTTSNGYTADVIQGMTFIDGTLIVNKTYSIPSDYDPGLTDDTYSAFQSMLSDAYDDDIILWIQSGYRSYDYQDGLHKYYKRQGPPDVESYSARPGHSEHQAGLALDINVAGDSSFADTPEGEWLNDHAWEYGFIYRYPEGKEDITGYMAEPWHYRYVGKSLAKTLYNDGDWITIEEYFGIDSKYAD